MGTTQGKNIPFASTATPGKVMVDGSSITISNGTISSHAGSGGGITAVTGVSPIAVSSGGTPAVSLGSVPFKNISAALRAHGFTF
jgi:hypothetical protein